MAGWFATGPWNLALITLAVAVATLASVSSARRRPPRVRRLPALAAMEEAVGRATELGRPVYFVPGSRDLDNVETVAGLAVLGQVARLTALHECALVVPTDRSVVMATAREACRAAYAAAGRPDAWRDENVQYVSDDQFSFAARLDGMIARERPAATFLLGFFGSESLLIAEAGRQAGALQIAGTAEPSQIPFFVASCDYTLIGEELFAASACMTGDPEQLGALRAQDLGKALAVIALLAGALLSTAVALGAGGPFAAAREALLHLFATRSG